MSDITAVQASFAKLLGVCKLHHFYKILFLHFICLHIGMEKNSKEDNMKRETLIWIPQKYEHFIQAMPTQHYLGNRVDGTFTSTAYSNIIKELH